MKPWKCTVCGYRHDGRQTAGTMSGLRGQPFQFILYERRCPRLWRPCSGGLCRGVQGSGPQPGLCPKGQTGGFPGQWPVFSGPWPRPKGFTRQEYLKYLEGVVGDTAENLKTAFENEIKAKGEIYPPLIREALAQKREDVAWSFIRARDVEDRHAGLYKETLWAMVSDREIVYHVCQICGYVFDGSAGNMPGLPDRQGPV